MATMGQAKPTPIRTGQREQSLVLGFGIILALGARLSLTPFRSEDFTLFTRVWFEAIDIMGPAGFLAHGVTNYAPMYTYAMVAAYYIFGWLPAVVAIKMIALPFDFLCAFYVARLVHLRHPSRAVFTTVFLMALFLPTLLINGSMWGQADVIYTTGIVAFLYYVASGRSTAAAIALGLAFSVKLQTAFLAPLVVLFALAGLLRWRSVALIPAIYIGSVVPAWLAGRPLLELLTIYWTQAGYYPRLTSNAAHVYQWISPEMYEAVLPAALLWATGVIGLFTYALYRTQLTWSAERIVHVAIICLLLVPYCTPKMHERYFFPADVLSLALAFYLPRLAFVPVAVGLISLLSYAPFLLRKEIVALPYLALAMGAVLVVLLYDLGRSVVAERVQQAEDIEPRKAPIAVPERTDFAKRPRRLTGARSLVGLE